MIHASEALFGLLYLHSNEGVPWRYDDVGRWTHEAGDCTVRALAIACEVPYSEAINLLWEAGRLYRDGFDLDSFLPDTVINGRRFIRWPFHGTLQEYSATKPERSIVNIDEPAHSLAIVNGIVLDIARPLGEWVIRSVWKVRPA